MSKWTSAFFAGLLIGILTSTVGFRLPSCVTRDPVAVEPRPLRAVLKLGHGLDTSHPVHVAMESMKKRLEELSSGG